MEVVSDAGDERRRRRWADPAAVMVEFTTAGASGGVKCRSESLHLSHTDAPGLRTGGWQGRRGVSAECAKTMHTWVVLDLARRHDTTLARVQYASWPFE